MKKETKFIQVDATNNNYYNFFFNQEYEESIRSNLKAGWRLIFIKDLPDRYEAIAIFEKEYSNDSEHIESK